MQPAFRKEKNRSQLLCFCINEKGDAGAGEGKGLSVFWRCCGLEFISACVCFVCVSECTCASDMNTHTWSITLSYLLCFFFLIIYIFNQRVCVYNIVIFRWKQSDSIMHRCVYIYIYLFIYIYLHILLPYRLLLSDTEYSSLYYTTDTCYLSITCSRVYMLNPTPNFLSPSHLPL